MDAARYRSASSDDNAFPAIIELQMGVAAPEPGTYAVMLPALSTLAQRPQLALELIDGLTACIGFLTHRVRGPDSKDVYGRVVDLPVSLAQREDGQVVLPRLTQQAIGERIGSSRSMVNRLLKGLVMGGYLVIEDDRMLLLRPLPRSW